MHAPERGRREHRTWKVVERVVPQIQTLEIRSPQHARGWSQVDLRRARIWAVRLWQHQPIFVVTGARVLPDQEAWRRRILGEGNRRYAELRADAWAWQELTAEQALWDEASPGLVDDAEESTTQALASTLITPNG